MTLVSAKIVKVDELPLGVRNKLILGDTKFVVIELREDIIPLDNETGIRGYFLSLGDFKDVEINMQ